jgi:bud site selection protein 20
LVETKKNSKRAAPVVVGGRTPYNSTKRRRREEELFHARNNKRTTTGTRERERERERVVLIRIRIMPKSKTKQHKHKGNHGHKYLHKQKLRATFLATHVDVLYDEYHEPEKPGTVNRTELNEDVPGMGKFYCKVTGRHFESALALKNHTKTKRFKKLKKQIANGPKPHNQRDAEAAAGMAPPTNS